MNFINNTLSISLLYDYKYNIRTFVCYDGKEYQDITNEIAEPSFLQNLINNNIIYVFDIKYFTKFLIKRNIEINSDKLWDLKLAIHLTYKENNTNIQLCDITKNNDFIDLCNRITAFKKIYKQEYLTYTPSYILSNYIILESKEIFDLFKTIEPLDDYYTMIKDCVISLGQCELNGIKVRNDSTLDKNKIIDGYIYPNYYYDHSNTGRILNKYPLSLQNIPKNSELRKEFVSRYENGKIIMADWNSMDLRVAFAMANESIHTDDLHIYVAKLVFEKENISEDEREQIKQVNLSILYSAGIDTIVEQLKIDKEQVKLTIKKLYEKFPNLKIFIDNKISFALKNGYAESFFGRKRYLGKTDFTKFVNSSTQSTSSDICLRAINFIQFYLHKNNPESENIKLIPYIVYDKIALDVHPDYLHKAERILKMAMSDIAPDDLKLKVNFPIKLEYRETL